MKTRTLAGAWIALGLVGGIRAGDTIESAEKAIIQANEKIKSLSAKMNMKADMDMPTGKMSQTADGTLEYVRHGEKLKFRVDLKSTMVMGGENGQKMESTILSIGDGEVVYTLTEQMGMKQAFKSKPDAGSAPITAKSIFETMKKDNDLKLLADETVDGKASWAVEATPKKADPMSPVAKIIVYFAKDSGLVIKQVSQNNDGQPVQSIAFSDFKVDADINPNRFEFKAPEGVQVIDMTGQPPAPGGAP
jgi:outer membrane lipoprotein-sorting protein